MFEGYLELGGGEVLNSARSLGYTKTADCPVSWLVCPPCDGVASALGDNPYTFSNISEAPWYDFEDEVTHRFMGAHGISIEGLPDSTREATVAEGILDGGVVGRVRKATRRMRVRAMLSAIGEDALEAGFSWLESALSPGRCGTHGDACGAADMKIWAACPPEPTDFTKDELIWNDPNTNLALNPSFETGMAPAPILTNIATNPSFETPAGAPTIAQTNLFTNPSFETLGAPTVLRTNQAPSPSFEKVMALQEVRRNLLLNPSLTRTFAQWSFDTAAVPVLDTGARFNPSSEILAGCIARHEPVAVPGSSKVVASIEVSVANDHPAVTLYLNLRLMDDGPQASGAPVTIQPGQTVRLSTPVGIAVPTGNTARIEVWPSGAGVPAGSMFYLRNAMVEIAQTALPYFDGSTLNAGDWTYAWTGATDASPSLQSGYGVADAGADYGTLSGQNVIAISSTEWASNRSHSARVIVGKQGANDTCVSVGGDNGALRLGMQAGKTYTAKATLRIVKPLVGTLNARALSIMVHLDGGGSVTAQSPAVPNVAGVYPVSVTFTVPAGSNAAWVRLYVGSATPGDEVWWDDFMIVEGTYTGGYFDGSTPVKTARNIILNPRAVASGAQSWIGPGGQPVPSNGHPNGHTTFETTGGGEIATYARATGTPGTTALSHMTMTFAGGSPSLPNQAYSGSVMVRSSVAATVQVYTWFANSGYPISGTADPVTLVPNVWTKVSFTNLVSKSNATDGVEMTVMTPSGVLIGDGQTLDVAHPIMVLGPTAPAYFDGSMPGAAWEGAPDASASYTYDPAFTYAWTGTPDASTSTQSSQAPVGMGEGPADHNSVTVLSSTAWAANRTRSVALVADGKANGPPAWESFAAVGGDQGAFRLGMQAGKTYTARATLHLTAAQTGTLSAKARAIVPYVNSAGNFLEYPSPSAPNVPGTYPVSVTFTIPADATQAFIRLFHGSGVAGETVWWDEFLLVEGAYSGPYFDGSTTDGVDGTFDWTGVPDASTSTRSILGVAGVPFPLGAEMQQTGDSPAHGAAALRFTIKTTIGVVLGVTTAMPTQGGTYTLVGKVRPRTRDQAFTPQIRGTHGPAFTALKDVWTDFRATVVAGGGSDYDTGLFIQSGSGHMVDDVIDVDAVAVVRGYAPSFFDGGTPDGGEFTYDWTGTPNASTSTLSAPGVAHVNPNAGWAVTRWQATESPANRTKIMRHILNQTTVTALPVMDLTLTNGVSYTMIGKVRPKNRDQVFTPRIGGGDGLPFTAPAGVWTSFRASAVANAPTPANTGLYLADASGHQVGDIVDIDAVAVFEGDYTGEYFDGSFPDTEAPYNDYEWLGTPDASASTYRTGQVTTVPDPDTYEAALARLVRNLHTVTCVSGPIVEQKFHRGETWGYLVEFVLVAAVPWMFGETKPVTLSPSLPIVVQDVPFNLVPYPSAELALGSVIAATNYATNPSVEVDLTQWHANGTGSADFVVISQTSELYSVGSKGAKAVFTAPAAGSAQSIRLHQSANLPAIPGARYSLNLWASASVESGTAVLDRIDYTVQWYNGATYLGEVIFGTAPPSGGARSIRSLLPPAGANIATVNARLHLTSWSAGAIVRLYADALAVTVP